MGAEGRRCVGEKKQGDPVWRRKEKSRGAAICFGEGLG